MDNSWPVFFKTTCIVLGNLQKVAGGKKFLELLLEMVNFTGYRLIRITLIVYCEFVAGRGVLVEVNIRSFYFNKKLKAHFPCDF